MNELRKYNDLSSDLDSLSKQVVDCIFQVHQKLGAGYLEKIYEDCLCIELEDHGINFVRQYPMNLIYNGKSIPSDFRLDLVVEDKILIELKAVETLLPVHGAQVYSYLKMSKIPLGFLVNFNVPLIKDGIKRYVPKNFVTS
jgi:GxxExxY protein